MADRPGQPSPYVAGVYDPREPQSAPQWPADGQAVHAGSTTPLPANLAPAQPTLQTTRHRRSVLGDVTAGLLLGDFAQDLGLPGAATQIVISFVPLLGSTCAVRDLVADLRHRDHVGAFLNFLALTPILGGFSKTFEVIRSTAHVGHAMHVGHQRAERRRAEIQTPTPAPRRRGRR